MPLNDRNLSDEPVLIIVCGKIEHNLTHPFGDVYWQTGYIIKKGHSIAEQGNTSMCKPTLHTAQTHIQEPEKMNRF